MVTLSRQCGATLRGALGIGLAFFCLVLTVTGCEPRELVICPASDNERLPHPAFTVRGFPRDYPLEYRELKVLDVSGPCGSQGCPVIWHMESKGANSPERFRHGESLPGFLARVAARPLANGRQYHVSASYFQPVFGIIAAGSLAFRVDASGIVRVSPDNLKMNRCFERRAT